MVHPGGERPPPLFLWLHGRTVSKELESARYQRLARAGFATCALDLPGHGERFRRELQEPEAIPQLLAEALAELDQVLDALRASPWAARLDLERLAIGGMSAGGMVTLRRLCRAHPFRCVVVEATAGDLRAAGGNPANRLTRAAEAGLDPAAHLAGWRPLPLLALHSETDQIVPVVGIRRFVERLRARYRQAGADPAQVELVTWEQTGAAAEHAGFGRRSAEARRLLIAFLERHLG